LDTLEELSKLLVSGRKLSMGAEAAIYTVSFLGTDLLVKYRFPKKYIHPLLSEELIIKRTKREARILTNTNLNGICVPRLIFAIISKGILVMERIKGLRLDELIEKVYPTEDENKKFRKLYFNIGVALGRLHSMNITHGDFSISNIVIREKYPQDPCIIDFGLSEFTADSENRAMDLHILFKSMESRFPRYLTFFREKVVQGYKMESPDYNSVIKRLKEMELRGRYVRERRQKNKTGICDF
jgi:TP53 regulating kinase-like protein